MSEQKKNDELVYLDKAFFGLKTVHRPLVVDNHERHAIDTLHPGSCDHLFHTILIFRGA